jgi:hypothetical protein
MGVFDLKKGVVASGINKEDGTLWNNLMAYEAANGKVLFREVKYNEVEKKFDSKDIGSVEIPVGAIRQLNAAQVSDSFNWLLLSSKTRGGLWNLETGERKLYVRGFKGGAVANDGAGVGDFPGEVTLYDLDTGERQANFVIDANAALVRFNFDGNKLFILSAAQSAYTFDLNKLAMRIAAQ